MYRLSNLWPAQHQTGMTHSELRPVLGVKLYGAQINPHFSRYFERGRACPGFSRAKRAFRLGQGLSRRQNRLSPSDPHGSLGDSPPRLLWRWCVFNPARPRLRIDSATVRTPRSKPAHIRDRPIGRASSLRATHPPREASTTPAKAQRC